MTSSSRPPILVATSHGTDSPAGRSAIHALVAAVRRRLSGTQVVEAFVDVQNPAVGDVVRVADEPCVVVPLLLSPGFHVHHQIADAVALSPEHRAAATLGPDLRLAEIMLERLIDAGAGRGDAVIMAAAGSTESAARDATEAMARLIAGQWGSPVPVGYLGGTGMPLADVIAAQRSSRRRIALASYLLADGHFQDMLLAAAAGVRARPLLDGGEPDARLVELVVDRYRAAVAEREM